MEQEIASESAFLEDPNSQEEFLQRLAGLKALLDDPAEWDRLEEDMSTLRGDFETKREELQTLFNKKYGQVQGLANHLVEQGVEGVTVQDVARVLEAEGIALEDLSSLTLPTTPKNYRKLFNALKTLDPKLNELLGAKGESPLRDQVQMRLKQDLAALIPEGAGADMVEFLTAAYAIPVPEVAEIRAQFGLDRKGDAVESDRSLNANAGYIIDQFISGIQSGDFEPLLNDRVRNIEWDGWNWDRGNCGNAWRRALGALYGALGKDKTLLKSFLRQNVPSEVLIEIHSIFTPGGHHSSLSGDLLTTGEIMSVFEEIFDSPPLD